MSLINRYDNKKEKINNSFLAKTSISAIGYKIKIGENIDNNIILFNLIFLKKRNNKLK